MQIDGNKLLLFLLPIPYTLYPVTLKPGFKVQLLCVALNKSSNLPEPLFHMCG